MCNETLNLRNIRGSIGKAVRRSDKPEEQWLAVMFECYCTPSVSLENLKVFPRN